MVPMVTGHLAHVTGPGEPLLDKSAAPISPASGAREGGPGGTQGAHPNLSVLLSSTSHHALSLLEECLVPSSRAAVPYSPGLCSCCVFHLEHV